DSVLVRPVVYGRCRLEVPMGRRGGNRPFQSCRFPRIDRRLGSLEHAVEKVHQKRNSRQAKRERAERYKHVNWLLTSKMFVLGRISNSAHHSVQSQVMHREKRAIKEDQREDEMNFAPGFIHHSTEHFGEPEIDRSKYTERAASEEHVVNMAHDKVGVMDKQIEGGGSHVDPTQTADDKHRNERERKTHCR